MSQLACIDLSSDDEVDRCDDPITDVPLSIDTTRPWIVDEMDSIRTQIKVGDADVLVMNELYVYEKLSAPIMLKIGERSVEGIILFSFNGTVELEVKEENIRGVFEVPEEFLKIASEVCGNSETHESSHNDSDGDNDSSVHEVDQYE